MRKLLLLFNEKSRLKPLFNFLMLSGFLITNAYQVNAQCPPGAVCATYTTGDIATDFDFNSPADFPAACLGSVSVTIPAGNWVDSVSTSYDMTAASGAWMNEQVSWLYSPATASGEPQVAVGVGLGGTFSYNRTGLSFANTATGTFSIELHAGRTWGGSGCDPSFNKVDNSTWEVIVYHSAAPSCLPPSAPQFVGASATTANFSWTASAASTGYEYEVRASGAAGSGATGLIASGTATGTTASASGLTANTSYVFYVRSNCGGTAGFSPWTSGTSFLTSCTVFTAPFNENFDNTANWAGRTTVDPCWTTTPSAGSTWSWEPRSTAPTSGNGPLGDLTGGSFMYCEASLGGSFPDAEFVSPLIDVSGLTAPALYFHQHRFSGGTIGDMQVEVSNDLGSTWTNIYTITGDLQTSAADAWSLEFINLGSYIGDTVQIKFKQSFNGCCGDAAIDSLVVDEAPTCPWPGNFVSNSTTANTATFSWNDPTGSNWDIEYGTPGFPQGTGTVVPVSSNPGTITGLTAGTTYDAYIRANCTSSSNGTSIWIGPVAFTTLCNVFTAPLTENFDDTTWVASGNNAGNQLNPCWIAFPPASDGGEPFKWIPRSSAPGSGNGPLQDVTGGNYLYCEASGSANGDSAWIQSPAVDVSGLTTPAVYFEQHRFSSGATIADMKVQVSNDFGTTWTTEYSITGDVQTASADPYELVFVNLGAYAGDTILVRFQQDGNGCCGDAAIDKVEIKEAPTCPWPTGQSFVGATDTTATIGWNDPTGTNWDIEWGPVGFTQGTGAVTSVANDTVTFGPLSPNTCYDVYVRANCSANSNGVSIWRGPIEFCTQCTPFTFPYVQSFDGTTAPDLDNCWSPLAFSASASNFLLQTNSFTNLSPANSMQLGSGSTTSGFIGIASPRFSDLDTTKRIEFQVNEQTGFFGGGADLIVGVMSDLTDASTFELIDTIFSANMTDNAWSFIIMDLDNHSLTSGGHVVFQHGLNNTFSNLYIDDFSYDEIPSCQAPLANTLGIIGASTAGATATWGAGSQGVKTYFAWGTAGFVPRVAGQLGIDSVAGTIDQGSITSLAPQTTYEFYVQDSCAGSGLSPWIGPFSFTTPCVTASMPYYESFDTWALACWDSSGGSTFFSPYSATTGQYARADFWFNNGGTYELTSRPIDINVDAQLKFDWSHLYSSAYPDDQLLVMVKTLSSTTWDTILDLKGPNNFNDPTAGNANSPGQFVTEEITLDPATYTGDTIQVRLFAISDWGPDLFINDLYVEAAPNCPNLANLAATNIGANTADLGWNNSPNALSYEVWYGPLGFYQGTLTAGGTVVNSGTNPTTISGIVPSTCYEFLVRAICGPGDTTAWSGPETFCTPCVPVNLAYYESFNAWPLTCWDETGGTTNWVQASAGGGSYARADFWSNNGGTYVLTSPAVIVSADAQVRFDWSHLYSSAYPDDQLLVLAKTLSATSWDTIVDLKGPTNFNDPTAGNSNSPGSFINEIAFLDPLTYTGDTVIVQLYAISDWGPDLFVEDFYVEAIPSCPPSSNLTATNLTATTADLAWTAATANPGANFQVSYDTNLSVPSAGITQLVSGTSVTLTGLMGSSQYCYFVREICAPGDTSSWTGPECFSTLCVPIAAPYTQNFDNVPTATAGDLGNCWNTIPATTAAFSFRTNTGGTTSGNTGPVGDATSGAGVYVYTEATSGSVSDLAELYSPQIDLTPLSNPEFGFSYHMYGATIDSLILEINDGTGWQTLMFLQGEQQTASSDPWRDTTVDLSAYSGTVGFRFLVVRGTSFTGDVAIDDVFVDNVPGAPCASPTALAHNTVRCDSVEVSWSSPASTLQTVLEYGAIGFAPGSGTLVANATSPQLLAGLTVSSDYDVYVVDICATDTSAPVGPYTFNTGTVGSPVAAFNATQQSATLNGQDVNFDASTSTGNANSYAWDFGDGNSAVGAVFTHSYLTNNTFTVTLIVTNACGSDTITQTVTTSEIGLAENALGRSLNVFPNPASDVVNVSFETISTRDVRLRLVDAQGREIMVVEEKVSESTYQKAISVKALSSGMYILEVQNGDLKARRAISVK